MHRFKERALSHPEHLRLPHSAHRGRRYRRSSQSSGFATVRSKTCRGAAYPNLQRLEQVKRRSIGIDALYRIAASALRYVTSLQCPVARSGPGQASRCFCDRFLHTQRARDRRMVPGSWHHARSNEPLYAPNGHHLTTQRARRHNDRGAFASLRVCEEKLIMPPKSQMWLQEWPS